MTNKNNFSPISYIWISIIASILTISLKSIAYLITGSVGLLSDALESFINLAAGIMALILLTISLKPPDKEHPFGHNKAEYFSSAVEGILILIASIAIGVTSIERLLNPHDLSSLDIGLIISFIASIINFITARILLKAGKKYKSIALTTDAQHLMTDVYTTGGVLVGIGLVKISGLLWLDPIIAIIVAINIVFTGIKVIFHSVVGLMDTALPEEEQLQINKILEKYKNQKIKHHALYTRKASSKNFIFFHILVPGNWTIIKGHKITKEIETKIKAIMPNSEVFIHLEPLNDPDAFDDYLESIPKN